MARVRVYPHNDLMNLAHYQRETIRNKVAADEEDAVALDCLSCLVSLAFSVEAIVNLVGTKRVKGWKERKPYYVKISQVCSVAGVEFDKSVGVYKSLWELKELRDSIAHGKPIEFTTDAKTRDELRVQMQCPWDSSLTPDYVETAYETVKTFERMLFENCKIAVGETVTSAVMAGK
ncbi:hypothetical protein [Grimontia sp. NTOU-MAR1]|uniref:hypothetical protein n=1 Tax=Grimontia sp. NTOU-MAR1 TaxID=3111011 RepID=UPI002DB8F89A|nr:hypothetical protein [Grimontia sp. NTOU-MAR1]WRV96402.1 hypothetical protein VP504_09690 [Grimontia sp. NTOU-MAR1]